MSLDLDFELQIFLDFDWQFLHVRKVFYYFCCATKGYCYYKDAILHLKKIMLLLHWKREN